MKRIFVLLIMGLVACVTPAADTVRVECTGKVTCPQNNPIRNVEVHLYHLEVGGKTGMSFEVRELGKSVTDDKGEFVYSYEKQKDAAVYSLLIAFTGQKGLSWGWAGSIEQAQNTFSIQLTQPLSISGTVVDEDKKPVAGAEVCLPILMLPAGGEMGMMVGWDESFQYFKTTTDEQGKFEIGGLPEGATAEFLVKKSGKALVHTLKQMSGQSLQYSAGRKDIEIVISNSIPLSGVVLGDKNKPLKDISVSIMETEMPMSFFRKPVTTDENGTFSITDLPAGDYKIAIESDGWLAEPTTIKLEKEMGIQIKAVKGTLVKITVMDTAAEQPVSGANVLLYQNQGGPAVPVLLKTDDKGVAQKQVLPGKYQVQVNKEGSGYTQGKELEVEKDKPAELTVQLGGTGKIKGTVNGPDGKPLADVEVRLLPENGPERNIPKTDNNGKFIVTWNPQMIQWTQGNYLLAAVSKDKKLAAAEAVNDETKDITIVLKPAISITGKVLAPDGKPLKSAAISVQIRGGNWSSTLDQHSSNYTNSEGVYKCEGLPANANYYISITGPKGYGTVSISADGESAENQQITTADTTLKIADKSVSGVTVDIESKPLEGVDIYCYGDGQPNISTKSDKKGKFTLSPVCEGPLTINANYNKNSQWMYANIETEGGATDVEIILASDSSGQRVAIKKPRPLLGQAFPAGIIAEPNMPAGKAVLVYVWDYQQRPSRYYVKELAKKAQILKAKDINVVLLQAEPMDKAAAEQWAKDNAGGFAMDMIAKDAEKVRFDLGVQGLPWMILMDKEHKVVAEGFKVEELDAAMEKIK